MGSDVSFRKVTELLCRWSGWEKANVEVERAIRTLCCCLDEMMASRVLMAENEKRSNSGFIPKVVQLGLVGVLFGE